MRLDKKSCPGIRGTYFSVVVREVETGQCECAFRPKFDASGPTILRIAVGGGTTVAWDLVQPAVAKFAHVREAPVQQPKIIIDSIRDILGRANQAP